MKIFEKKCHVIDRNDRIWLKNDDSPGESFPLTNFQSKSCTNLAQTEFWRKKKNNNHRNENFFKKISFRRPKRWNLAEKRWTSYGVLSVDPFQIEKLDQFKWNWILAQKKKKSTEWKIFEKMPFRRPKWWNFVEKWWTSKIV